VDNSLPVVSAYNSKLITSFALVVDFRLPVQGPMIVLARFDSVPQQGTVRGFPLARVLRLLQQVLLTRALVAKTLFEDLASSSYRGRRAGSEALLSAVVADNNYYMITIRAAKKIAWSSSGACRLGWACPHTVLQNHLLLGSARRVECLSASECPESVQAV
jgi:hypothetical protein